MIPLFTLSTFLCALLFGSTAIALANVAQDIGGIENLGRKPLSSTNKREGFHGLAAQTMTLAEIRETIQRFAGAARRTREAGLDAVEIHGGNGYLFSQFLSSAINDRTDEYGGSLENRARLYLDVIRAISTQVGDFSRLT
jgi:2,4-dienoyl-CoA reductase-like NADH-dependent reductase (Old Yellow Enzyme family)